MGVFDLKKTGKMSIEELYNAYLQCNGISTDTRQSLSGCLFFCLKGDNFDGNSFASQAVEKEAKYVVIDNDKYAIEGKTILVENTLNTLQQLAKYHRQQLNIPILGVTGTNGKTTTKELVKAVLSQKFKVLATQGNLNNHIGVPLTLLNINADTQIAIVEMGANHVGEIAQLCEIAMPNYGIITNIGKAHIEGFGSEEGIINTKRALYDYVTRVQGTLFVNHDDALLMKLSDTCTRLTYGNSKEADVRGVCNAQKLYMTFKLPQFNRTISTQLVGTYNFNNAMAAVSAGLHFGVDVEDIVYALISYKPTNNRSQIEYIGGHMVIMDAYNANPSSMNVAINNLAGLKAENKAVILGGMMELGTDSEQEHEKIVQLVKDNHIEQCYFFGETYMNTSADKANVYTDFEHLAQAIKDTLKPNSTILLKGSRLMRMERVVDVLKNEK